MKKPEKTDSTGAPKDVRKARLARQLRANLQRRKQQARDRGDEPDTPKSGEPRADTKKPGGGGA